MVSFQSIYVYINQIYQRNCGYYQQQSDSYLPPQYLDSQDKESQPKFAQYKTLSNFQSYSIQNPKTKQNSFLLKNKKAPMKKKQTCANFCIAILASLLFIWQTPPPQSSITGFVEAQCYANRKFPIVLNTETSKVDNLLTAVTADAQSIYAGGFASSTAYTTSGGQMATIFRHDLASMSWKWRRVYSEASSNFDTITALALNPASTKLACYAWTHANFAGSSHGFVFVVDANSGWKIQNALKIDQGSGKVMEIKSDRFLFGSNDKIYMAAYQIAGPKDNGYESRLRLIGIDYLTNTIVFSQDQTGVYGRAGALTFGGSPHGSNYVYMGGSADDLYQTTSTVSFHLSITQFDLDGGAYNQHFLQAHDLGGSIGGIYPNQINAPAIDHIRYWKENASTEWVFGTTRSHIVGREVQNIGAFKAQLQSNMSPLINTEFVKIGESAFPPTQEVYAVAVFPQMTFDGTDYCVHSIFNVVNTDSYYLKIDFNSNAILARRIQQGNHAIEAFFVGGSSLGTITQTTQGFQAYIAGQMQSWTLTGGSTLDLSVKAGTIHSSQVPSSSSCRLPADQTITATKDFHLTNIHVTPSAALNFSPITLTNSVENLLVEVAKLDSAIQAANQCYAGDQTSITSLQQGSSTTSYACYNNQSDVTLSFSPPSVLIPSGCSDVPWEYYLSLDAATTASPLPDTILYQFELVNSNELTFALWDGSYPGPAFTTQQEFLINIMAAEPTSGAEVLVFQMTLQTNCCDFPTTSWNLPTVSPTSFTYKMRDTQGAYTVNTFSTSSGACCQPLFYETVITPTPPPSVFTIDPLNSRHVTWYTNDLSLSSTLVGTTYTVTVTAKIGCSPDSTFDRSVSYTVDFIDNCPASTHSLDPLNVLLQTQPIGTYAINASEMTISWPVSEIQTTSEQPLCGNLVYDLVDITSGLETAIANPPFTFDFSSDPQEIKILTSDSNLIGTYNFRYIISLQDYPPQTTSQFLQVPNSNHPIFQFIFGNYKKLPLFYKPHTLFKRGKSQFII